MKKSFTLIELVIVIIVVAILVIKSNFVLSDTSLNQAADQVIDNINYTHQLALQDNKFQYYPINSSDIELNRTKYWFKQWWHFKITDAGDDIIIYIFQDLPRDSSSTNFDKKTVTKAQYSQELATLTGKYLIGASKESTGSNNYPEDSQIFKKLNLSQSFGIKKIEFNAYSSSSMSDGKGKRIDILFDNYGNTYLKEGEAGDGGDINPYDEDERKPLTKIAKITLCANDNCEKNISICITPKVGFAYVCK